MLTNFNLLTGVWILKNQLFWPFIQFVFFYKSNFKSQTNVYTTDLKKYREVNNFKLTNTYDNRNPFLSIIMNVSCPLFN